MISDAQRIKNLMASNRILRDELARAFALLSDRTRQYEAARALLRLIHAEVTVADGNIADALDAAVDPGLDDKFAYVAGVRIPLYAKP